MVLIIAQNAEQAEDYARRLLEHADHPNEVATETTQANAVVAFEVSEELAKKAGFDTAEPEPAEPETGEAETEAPGRNASTAEWREFLSAQEPPVEFPADAKRDELVAIWDARK